MKRAMNIEEVRSRIQVSKILDRLQQHGDGSLEKPLEPSQIEAYKLLLSKSLPTLNSTDVHVIDDRDRLSEADILSRLSEMIAANPALADRLRLAQSVMVGGVADAHIVRGKAKKPVKTPK